jgi:hypothetical protein
MFQRRDLHFHKGPVAALAHNLQDVFFVAPEMIVVVKLPVQARGASFNSVQLLSDLGGNHASL